MSTSRGIICCVLQRSLPGASLLKRTAEESRRQAFFLNAESDIKVVTDLAGVASNVEKIDTSKLSLEATNWNPQRVPDIAEPLRVEDILRGLEISRPRRDHEVHMLRFLTNFICY